MVPNGQTRTIRQLTPRTVVSWPLTGLFSALRVRLDMPQDNAPAVPARLAGIALIALSTRPERV